MTTLFTSIPLESNQIENVEAALKFELECLDFRVKALTTTSLHF